MLSGGVLALTVVVFLGQTVIFGTGGNQPEDKKAPDNFAKSKIVKVTVYPTNALVTREVEVPAGAGVVEVVVPSLPTQVVNSSLYSEGTDALRVLSTRFRTRQVKEDTREDVRKLKEEIKKLQMEAQKIQAETRSIEQNMQMITKLENFTSVTTVSSTKEGGLNGEEVINLTKYVLEQRSQMSQQLVEKQQQLQANQEQTEFLNRKLQEVSAGSSKTERDAIVVVDRVKGQGGTIRLNYLVESVSWSPEYKLRAGKEDDPIEVDYLASLYQHTGEDWNGVNLVLSTAQPTLNAVPPDLKKLEVTVVARSDAGMPPFATPKSGQQPQADYGAYAPNLSQEGLKKKAMELRNQAQLYSNMKDITNTFKALNDAAAFEQAKELMQSADELRSELKKFSVKLARADGPSVTYHLPLKLSIPSRNDQQVVEITKLNFSPDYYYKSVPVINQNVYRLADLINKSEYVLLPGEATMYQGSDFVGRMTMPLVAIGEQFTVGLGVDPQLQIQRQLLDKTRGTQGGNQVLTYDYRILINSYKKEPVRMQVWDRLPHADNETVGVTLVSTTPDLSDDPLYEREQRPNNLLRWDLKVDPTMNGEKALTINYTFRMELAREMVINEVIAK